MLLLLLNHYLFQKQLLGGFQEHYEKDFRPTFLFHFIRNSILKNTQFSLLLAYSAL